MTARPSRAQAACLALMRSALIAESRCRHEGTEIHQWNRKRWEWTHKQRVWITKKHAYARFSLLKSLRYWDTTSNQCSLRVVDHLLTPCTDLLSAPLALVLPELQTINTLYSTCYWHSCISFILIWCELENGQVCAAPKKGTAFHYCQLNTFLSHFSEMLERYEIHS